MKRRYKNPPIVEAVCEIHFESDQLLTASQLLQIGELWKADYPNQQTVEEKNLELQVNLGNATVKTNPLGTRLIARSSDGTRIAQHSMRFLAVNQLKPYPGWSESFRANILSRIQDSVELFHFEKVRAVNLRYIDRLDFPQRPLIWSEWLTIGLPVPDCIPVAGGNFQFHYQQTLDNGLNVFTNLTTLPPENPDLTSIILDATVVWQGSTPLEKCEELLDSVHAPHPKLFDQMLSEKTQALLGGYETV